MKNFTQITVPHSDIVEGKLTMDVFAADLWQVANEKAPIDYQNPDFFFRKTYITKGLKNITDIAKSRLKGKSGDAIIQLQTSFGGGKTHTLIALYHMTKKWNAKVVVFDGTALSPNDVKPWEEFERQLTGKIEITKGDTAPGKEKLIELFSKNTPLLVLMDEVLEYITKAGGVVIGQSTLASQTFAFIQELTAAISTVGNALLILTLPSSILEHYDENAERMFQQLQKITGRTEKIYVPVDDEEIESVVRARLFEKIDEKGIKKIVDNFIKYIKNEGLLSGEELINYRERFLKSYPFKPEVIDVLYKRWGSFPTFQRTRGVLRFLSLVVYSLMDKNIPFIRLGDFDLGNGEIRRELTKHIGQEWDSIIAQDITSKDAGAKKVDNELGSSYKAYKLGTVVTTTIFMRSFSGRGERESSIRDIKLNTVYQEFHSSEIDNVINNLREKLFYLSDEGLFFTNQPNLNRIIIAREESISEDVIFEEEKRILRAHISNKFGFKVYVYPKFSKDISDTSELKLVILNKDKPGREFLEKCGEGLRVYRNTLIFLCTEEGQKEAFYLYLRRVLALKSIDGDKSLKLTENQKKDVKDKLKTYEQREYEELRKFYRRLFIPSKDGYKEEGLGVPTFGESLIDKEVYEFLKTKGEILERIAPKVIKNKYLLERDYVETKAIYDSFLKTAGEIRLISKEGFIDGIREGVENGLFGLGYIEEDKIKCKYINESPSVSLSYDEVIIKPEICVKEEDKPPMHTEGEEGSKESEGKKSDSDIRDPEGEEPPPIKIEDEVYSKIGLRLKVPQNQISSIAKILSYLSSKFEKIDIEVSISADKGEIELSDYEDKVIETLIQSNIEIKEEIGE